MDQIFRIDTIVPYGLPPLLTLGLCLFLASRTMREGRRVREYQLFTLICLWQVFYNIDLVLRTTILDPELMLAIVRIQHLFFVFGMPISVHTFCLSSRRATVRIHADGSCEYRHDPQWFTPYLRRETVEWPPIQSSRQQA